MQQHLYGHLPDHARIVEHDLLHTPLAALPGLVSLQHVAASPVTEMQYEHLLAENNDDVPDQLGTSSCVGNAFSTSVFLRAIILGRPILRPSRKAIYDIARLIDSPHQKMVDQGSRPYAACMGMQQYGLTTEARWPLIETLIDTDPPEDVFQHAIDAQVGSYYRIAPGTGCADGIEMALRSGYLPAFAMPVDQAYEDYDGSGIYQGVTGAVLGGHMQCVVGFGPGYLLVCNSWNRTWGYKGLSRIARKWFDSGQVTDILVPTIVPGGVS